MSGGRAAAIAVVLFLIVFAAILLVLHFLGVLLLAIAFFGIFLLIGIVLLIFAIGLVMIFMTFYYMLKKKPIVQEYGNYTLDQVKGKEDWDKEG
jgi:hypothetical protein